MKTHTSYSGIIIPRKTRARLEYIPCLAVHELL